MSTQESTVVHIAANEDVDALIARLPSLANEHVLVHVDDQCNALLTAAEFYRLLSEARTNQVALAISTDDPLRRELARMLGWSIVDRPSTDETPNPPSDVQVVEQSDQAENEPAHAHGWAQSTEQAQARFDERTTADLATYTPARKRGETPSVTPPDDPARPQSAPARPTAPRRHPAQTMTAQTASASEETIALKKPRSRKRVLVLISAIAAPLIVLAVAAGLIIVVLPTATVRLVPAERAIAADFTYGLAASGQSYDLIIEPQSLSSTTTFEKTIPTTGERFVPDGTASGTLSFSNPTTKAISLPSGTTFKAATGMNYITQAAITVPAADPFGAQTLGAASVKVAAAQPGPDGNLDAGTLIGQLDSGLYFTHREAFSGGTTKRIAVVSEADIAALKQEAEADLAARSEAEFRAKLVEGMQLVPDSLAISSATIEFSQPAGTDGTEVAVRASQSVAAKVFEPGKFIAEAKDEVGRRLAGQAGSDVILLGDRVTIGEPVALPGGTAFAVHAEGVVRAAITEDEQNALGKRLVGKSAEDAGQVVGSMADVSRYEIEIEPDWLPDRMPELAKRIEVLVATDENAVSRP